MRADPTPLPGDYDERPFSNGTEGETWTANVCGFGQGCIHDSTYGQADPDGDEIFCPLITLSLSEVWPREWERKTHTWTIGDQSGSYDVPGACSEFTEEYPPDPDGPPVIAVNLFGQYDAEPAGRREVDA